VKVVDSTRKIWIQRYRQKKGEKQPPAPQKPTDGLVPISFPIAPLLPGKWLVPPTSLGLLENYTPVTPHASGFYTPRLVKENNEFPVFPHSLFPVLPHSLFREPPSRPSRRSRTQVAPGEGRTNCIEVSKAGAPRIQWSRKAGDALETEPSERTVCRYSSCFYGPRDNYLRPYL